MTAIVLDGVSRHFGAATAVDNLSLTIPSNEFVTLLGQSGCGKTTTLRMVAGLEHNDAGTIHIGEQLVSDAARGWFMPPERRNIGMVFQSYAIWPHLSVFENVAYPLRVRRTPAAVIRDKVMAALRLVEMEAYADRPAPLLSGGQQQRVAIARALSFEPQLLLLDEPLSNLDARLRLTMGEEFRALQRRMQLTTLYVTHDQDEAMALSDRIVVMQHGRILQIGAPEVVYQRPASAAVAAFFGAPNLLPAAVEDCTRVDGETYRLDVAGETGWRGAVLAGERFERCERVLVVARSESIRIANPGEPRGDAQTAWAGTVVDSVFRGARRSLVVRCGEAAIKVETAAMQSAAKGEHVTLVANAADTWAVRAEATVAAAKAAP